LHGAMWYSIKLRDDTSLAWELHEKYCGFLKDENIHGWIDCCHGVGHALTFFGPRSDVKSSKQLTITEAASACEAQPYGDYRCAACCLDGIFHESANQMGNLSVYWASSDTKLLGKLSELDAKDPLTASMFRMCMQVDYMPFFCYRWQNFGSSALPQGHKGYIATCLEGVGTSLAGKGDAFKIMHEAGCVGGPSGTSYGKSDKITMDAQTKDLCSSLTEKSYSLWLACAYGVMHATSHFIFDAGYYAPVFRKDLYQHMVVPACKGFEDELAKLLCLCELYDGFAAATVVQDPSFLQALNLPLKSITGNPGAHAEAAQARKDAISHFSAYNSSLVTNPSKRPFALSWRGAR